MKKYGLAHSQFNNFFVTHRDIPANFNLLDLSLSELSHSQGPQHVKTYLQSLKTKPETHFYNGKVQESNFTSVEKANILSFIGTKGCLIENF